MDAEKVKNFQVAKTYYEELQEEYTKSSPDLEKCGKLLAQMQIFLVKLMYLPTLSLKLIPSDDIEALLFSRNVLEVGLEWSIEVKNISCFERYMSQLKYYYLDYKKMLPDSTKMYPFLGLNLLYLLSQNHVAEFHTELMRLPVDEIQNNKYIKHSVTLEQDLMIGRYNRIFEAAHKVPAPSYKIFMDILIGTIRKDLAKSIEMAYRKIPVKHATEILNLSNLQATLKFAKERNWKTVNGLFVFDINANGTSTDATWSIYKLLKYAAEMETIV